MKRDFDACILEKPPPTPSFSFFEISKKTKRECWVFTLLAMSQSHPHYSKLLSQGGKKLEYKKMPRRNTEHLA